jgi:hypothetical protein
VVQHPSGWLPPTRPDSRQAMKSITVPHSIPAQGTSRARSWASLLSKNKYATESARYGPPSAVVPIPPFWLSVLRTPPTTESASSTHANPDRFPETEAVHPLCLDGV